MQSLVPDDFVVPLLFETEAFHLHSLTVQDNELDFAAVTNSMSYRGGIDYEVKRLTKEKNLENLQRHEREFRGRNAFAYTVQSSDRKECIGCVYINPPTKGDFDAEVLLWVTVDAFNKGLDEKLYQIVCTWLNNVWPFKRVVYPGRDIGWEEWDQM